jgi:hypothetical protein
MKRALRLGLALCALLACNSTSVFADGTSLPPVCMPGMNCVVDGGSLPPVCMPGMNCVVDGGSLPPVCMPGMNCSVR